VEWPVIAGALWAVGTAVFISRAAAGVLTCARRRRRALPAANATKLAHAMSASLGLRRPVSVLLSDEITVAETFGLRTPVIALPLSAPEWPDDRTRLVLLHELFHIKRQDWAVHLLARFSAALFWFNPLARYGLARLCEERERACDDDVLRSGVARIEYAQELVAIAEACRATPAFAVAMARPAHLEGRIRAILNPQMNHRGLTMKSRIFTIISAALVIATASVVTAPAQIGAAKVSGVVSDASGARVPGAQVAISKGTAVETVRASEDGSFEFSGIPDGTYSLSVATPGFKRLVIPDVVANASTPAYLKLTLEIGGISERVTITAQGQPREQPPISSTALERAKPVTPRTTSFASVVSEPPTPAAGRTRIRVGGNVRPAKLIANPAPAYPPQLVAQGVEGTVILDSVIGINGQVLNVTPKNSQVHPDLIQAAVEAVKSWRYEPTLLNGQPIEVVTTVTCDFRLKP
jgi:TonB family protein